MPTQTPDPDPRVPRGGRNGAPGQDASGYFVAGTGITFVEELTLQQRALDRDRLDAYARMVNATMQVSTSVELAFRSLRAELAAALHVSEYTVERELDVAYTVATRYPGVRDVLGAGLIGLAHVQVICDAATVIGSADDSLHKHALYEEAVLKYAVEESPGRLKPIAKRLAEQFAEISIEQRHEVARRKRRVTVYAAEDGMAELYALLPAEVAFAIMDRMNRISKEVLRSEATDPAQPAEPAEPAEVTESAEASDTRRTLDEVRADTLAEVLLNGTPYTDLDLSDSGPSRFAAPGYFAHLQISVPVDALVGSATDEARPVSELAGYGPISTRVAAELLETSRNIFRIDHDASGQVLRVERYRPSKEMRQYLAARDQHCRFPGCTRVPFTCEIDHAIPWEDGGPTATDNLENLCKSHHTLKHHSAWAPELDPSGTIYWLSPSGRTHTERPPRREYRPGVSLRTSSAASKDDASKLKPRASGSRGPVRQKSEASAPVARAAATGVAGDTGAETPLPPRQYRRSTLPPAAAPEPRKGTRVRFTEPPPEQHSPSPHGSEPPETQDRRKRTGDEGFRTPGPNELAPPKQHISDGLTTFERHNLTCGCNTPQYHDLNYMAELAEKEAREHRRVQDPRDQPF